MNSIKKALALGVLVWIVTLLVAMLMYPIRTNDRILFEAIIPVVLAAALVFSCAYYFKAVKGDYVKEGLFLGLVWLGVSLTLDFFAFSRGPMQMTLVDYFKDIGATYIMMPVVTVGMGYMILMMQKNTGAK